MRPSDDESDDERGLLSEKWMTRSEKRSWQIWVASALCLFAGFALGTLFHKMPTPEILKKQQNSSVIAKAPFEQNVDTVFQPNMTFERATHGAEADALWEQLIPIGKGFITVKTDNKHADSETGPYQTKVVSAFHQMHCLNMIRKSLYDAVANDPSFQSELPRLAHHWKHCFDYLRQVMMCNADVTLEGVDPGDTGLGSVDGWGTERKCIDWQALKLWTERHRGIEGAEGD